jgi:hypothetical protein
MTRPRTGKRPSSRTKQGNKTMTTSGGESPPPRADCWPEVLTLVEAAAYLRVPKGAILDSP